MNILIVDDIPINRQMLGIILQSEGHTVVEAVDGLDALRRLEQGNIDAVISDLLMPNMDGFRLCYEIRKLEPWRGLPFIIYTATYASTDDEATARTVGVDGYLYKPASSEKLLETLREVTERNAAPATLEAEEESYVLQQYSQALVAKLEQTNAELSRSVESLQRAHAEILELNANLERRVQERTAELQEALANVKELSGLLPICTYCKKIRDSDDYWHQVENYIRGQTRAQFSHSICPDCMEKQMAEMEETLAKMDRKEPRTEQ